MDRNAKAALSTKVNVLSSFFSARGRSASGGNEELVRTAPPTCRLFSNDRHGESTRMQNHPKDPNLAFSLTEVFLRLLG